MSELGEMIRKTTDEAIKKLQGVPALFRSYSTLVLQLDQEERKEVFACVRQMALALVDVAEELDAICAELGAGAS